MPLSCPNGGIAAFGVTHLTPRPQGSRAVKCPSCGLRMRMSSLPAVDTLSVG